MKKYSNKITAVLIILFLGIIFHKSYINEFPSYIHAWAQSDRYALALGFVNNDLNFFKPETFTYNHQFPNDWEVPAKESITAVDFPIHDYIPAIFMKFSGVSSPWIFRLYILLYSFVGLFFLFRLAKLLTGDVYKSVFIVIFAATSPVFVYYQGGFLPTIPSLSNAFIGIYFYTYYLFDKSNKSFNLSILFLTLAALSRTTFAIHLIAILGLEFLRIIQHKTTLKPKIVSVLISVSTLLFFFLYNGFLREKYGSIFLNHILPAQNTQEFVEILRLVKQNWLTHYFSTIHYLLLILLVAISLYLIASKRIKIQQIPLAILFLSLIIVSGCIAFALLMLRQFPAHDYYFLDTFFLPVILLITITFSVIPSLNTKWMNGIYVFIILIFSIPMIINAANSQKDRRITGYWDRTTATINNFKNADKYLDTLNIPDHSKMLVIDPYAPNIPFILMNRKGYVVMSTQRENIEHALTWDYDYIVTQNEFFLSDIYSNYPEIISKTKKIFDNGQISICKLTDVETKQTLGKYLGLDDKTPVFKEMMNYDTIANKFWQNTNSTHEVHFSGANAGVLTKDMPYGLTYKTNKLSEITTKNRILLFQSYFLLPNSINNCEVVVSINENGQNTYYKSYNLQELLKNKGRWEKIDLMFELPQVKHEDYEFSLFIWNIGKNELFIDDFQFKIY